MNEATLILANVVGHEGSGYALRWATLTRVGQVDPAGAVQDHDLHGYGVGGHAKGEEEHGGLQGHPPVPLPVIGDGFLRF